MAIRRSGTAIDEVREATGQSIRVLVAERNLIEREGLCHLLSALPGLALIGAVRDVAALTTTCREFAPDVVVLGLGTDEVVAAAGIGFAAELRERGSSIGVVILSSRVDVAHGRAIFAHGSERRAYLLTDQLHDRTQLTMAIRAVATGASVIDPQLAEALAVERQQWEHGLLTELTAREREVLSLAAEGMSNGAIATALHLSQRAVEKHVNAIFLKLGLRQATTFSKRVRAVLMLLDDASTARFDLAPGNGRDR